MSKAYLQFTEDFSGLSPYEANHFCEVLLCKIEKQSGKMRPPLTEKELLLAFTHTMRDVALLLREQEMFTTTRIAA